MQASGNEINHKAVENTPEGSVLSSACEAASTSIDFVFPVPPKCPLVLRLYFADATNTTRPVSIITNNLKQGSDYNIGLSGNGGDTVELKMPETAGLLELRILALSELPAIISGLQILSTGECTQSSALDTTGTVPAMNIFDRYLCISGSIGRVFGGCWLWYTV